MIDLYIVILALCVAAIIGIVGYIHVLDNDIADLYEMIRIAIEEEESEEEESYNKSDNQLTGYQ